MHNDNTPSVVPDQSRSRSYRQQLLDPRWQKKRLKILERDQWLCIECKAADRTLHVHHSHYSDDAEGPWDYDDHTLITLCAECHEVEQGELREFRHEVLELMARWGGVRRAADMRRIVTAFHTYDFPLTPEELHTLTDIIGCALVSRVAENDGGDLWRNLIGLLEPYSRYPHKKDDER